MCFSAEASFIGAGVVGVAGVGALALVRKPREIPFAALPLLFAFHQAMEGITWRNLDGRGAAILTGWGVHAWVFYAWAFLPAYVPWAVWLIEPDAKRRRLMTIPLAVGVGLALFMLTQAFQSGISVSVVAENLDYKLPFDESWILAFPYVLATCITPAMSTQRWVRVFGIGNFVAMSAAGIIQWKDYSSIWCTFAAFLSIIIFVHYLSLRRPFARHDEPVAVPSG